LLDPWDGSDPLSSTDTAQSCLCLALFVPFDCTETQSLLGQHQQLRHYLHELHVTAGVGVMWITFMYGEMNRDSWQSQSTWMQGFMYSKVLSGLLCQPEDLYVCLMHAAADYPSSDTMCKMCMIGGMH